MEHSKLVVNTLVTCKCKYLASWMRLATEQPKPHNYQKTTTTPSRVYLGDDYPNVYLTRQEARVAALMLKDFCGKKIARQLDISQRTVESYKEIIYRKLDCHNQRTAIEKLKSMQLFCHE